MIESFDMVSVLCLACVSFSCVKGCSAGDSRSAACHCVCKYDSFLVGRFSCG